MWWLIIAAVAVLACFALVLTRGAPYLPTLTPQIETALELVDLKPGETLLELGCGDGKVLIAAAQTGLHAVGYELNPILAGIAWLRTRRFKGQVKVVWGDFWRSDWPPAQAIFTFLHPRFMNRLDTKIVQYNYKPVKLASFAFQVPSKTATKDKRGVYLYDYHATETVSGKTEPPQRGH